MGNYMRRLKKKLKFEEKPPALVTLEIPAFMSYTAAMERLIKKHLLEVGAAHSGFNHMFGQPCIVLLSPRVNEKNIVRILTHETIHHAIQNLGEDTADLDLLLFRLPERHPLRRFLL